MMIPCSCRVGGGWKTRPRKTMTSCMDGGGPSPMQDILHKSIKRLPLIRIRIRIHILYPYPYPLSIIRYPYPYPYPPSKSPKSHCYIRFGIL